MERNDGGGWAALGMVWPNGSGWFSYRDSSVTAGTRYGYQLVAAGAAGERPVGEAWVNVPGTLAMRLEGARPNPVVDGMHVEYSLPDSRSARLEVFDVVGRRIDSREVGRLGSV